jgi:glycosyltransferase involved in cell wall biosynthesis
MLFAYLIHNAVETHAFSIAKRDAVRHQMGWQDALVVSCVARLVPAKGQIYAIQALPELVQAIPNLKLVLIGDGGERDKLAQLADTLNITQHIVMLGARTDVSDLLAATDIYLQPSIKEGFCIAFLEAMATGLVCIGTQTGAIPSMVINDSGILIPSADVPAIISAVSRLAQDQPLRQQYAQAARATANMQFSPEKQARNTVAVYQSLVSG